LSILPAVRDIIKLTNAAESAVKDAKKIIMKCNKAGTVTCLALLDHRYNVCSVEEREVFYLCLLNYSSQVQQMMI
jgi:hypothetical protein